MTTPAPRAAGVENFIRLKPPGLKLLRAKIQRGGRSANRFRESNDLFDGFALHVERDQQRPDLRVGALACEDFRHYTARFFAGERLAMVRDAMEGVEDHTYV